MGSIDVADYLEEKYGYDVFVVAVEDDKVFVEVPDSMTEDVSEDLLSAGVHLIDVGNFPGHDTEPGCDLLMVTC